MSLDTLPEMRFEAPVPGKNTGTYFFALCTAGGKGGGVQFTPDTANAVDAAVRRIVAAQMHTWFELDSVVTDANPFFAMSAYGALQHAIQQYHHQLHERWRLTGLDFSEATGKFTHRVEPDEQQKKLKLRPAAAVARRPEDEKTSSCSAAATAGFLPLKENNALLCTAEEEDTRRTTDSTTRHKYRAGTPVVRRGHSTDPAAAPPKKDDDVLTLATSEAAAEEYLREYAAAVEHARQIRMDASRRFIEKMGIVDTGGASGGGNASL